MQAQHGQVIERACAHHIRTGAKTVDAFYLDLNFTSADDVIVGQHISLCASGGLRRQGRGRLSSHRRQSVGANKAATSTPSHSLGAPHDPVFVQPVTNNPSKRYIPFQLHKELYHRGRCRLKNVGNRRALVEFPRFVLAASGASMAKLLARRRGRHDAACCKNSIDLHQGFDFLRRAFWPAVRLRDLCPGLNDGSGCCRQTSCRPHVM